MYELIKKIHGVEDVKKFSLEELKLLAGEIREALFNRLTHIGGHFGPNFGMVEAEIAMHYVFHSPVDKIVFDVSHQSYPHKILTGRKEGYIDEDRFREDSGYTNPDESEHDFFNIGHTSTSIALASGLAKARDLKGDHENIIAVIGDGSLSGGEAIEALNVVGSELNSNFIVVVNDNEMAIAETHGGIYKNLKELRDTNGKASNNLFKAFGLDYRYVENGNDIETMVEAFREVKDIDHPIVLHIHTIKGFGYKLAEKNKENWHWTLPFDRSTGIPTVDFGEGEDYTSITAKYIMDKAKKDKDLLVITPAMPSAAGLDAHLRKDVGINRTPVTILLNYSSFDAMTDVTHLGIFGIPEFANIPNLVVLAPSSKSEYIHMLDWSLDQKEHPVMILIPGNEVTYRESDKDYSQLGSFKMERKGEKVAIIALGDFYQRGEKLADEIEKELSFKPTLINPRFASSIDQEMLEELEKQHKLVVTLEDGVVEGGFGQKIASFYGISPMKVKNYGLDKVFYDRYSPSKLVKELGMDNESIIADIHKVLEDMIS